MRRRERRRWAPGSLLALAMAASWALGLWLIVLGLFSVVVVRARQRFLSGHRLPIRLIAWALHAPHGPSPPVAIEHAIAVDLAVISEGHLDRLDRAQVVLRALRHARARGGAQPGRPRRQRPADHPTGAGSPGSRGIP